MAIKAGRVGVDPSQVTLSGYIKGGGVSPEVLTKEEAQRIYQTILGMSDYLKKVDANQLYQKISDMVDYQAKLISGQNIKRINGEDILGSGNITVLTRTLADGIYQTISGMSAYALKSEIPDMDDVLTKVEAPGYDDILTRTQAQLLYNYLGGEGIEIINSTISNVFADKDNVDLDSVTYQYRGHVTNCTNQPVNMPASGELFAIFDENSSTGVQLYTPTGSGYFWIRKFISNTWATWEMFRPLPSGGSTGDLLVKQSSTDGDVDWETRYTVPSGGSSGQVLTKSSNADGSFAWGDRMRLVSNPVNGHILATNSNGEAIDGGASVDELKCLVFSISSFSSLPQTFNDSRITDDMVVIECVKSNPAVQTSDWMVTTNNGSLTISGTISGSTAATLYLLKQRS